MKRPDAMEPEALELAALYAIDALPQPEREALERRFDGDERFWLEVESMRGTADALAGQAPPAAPGRDLWPDVLARVRQAPDSTSDVDRDEAPDSPRIQVWREWSSAGSPGPMTLLRGSEGEFEPTAIEGIVARRLSVDEEADRITMLVRMAPGTAYPAHRHGGPEECFVLEGDLTVGDDVELTAGDFQRMESGSVHPVQATRGGCLLLLVSSRNDELLAG